MPVQGRKPSPDGQRRNRAQPTHEWVEVPDVPYADAPDLPDRRPAWPEATRRWWAAVSTMPHCAIWTPSEWQFAFDSAEIAALFHERPSPTFSRELRDREKVMGTTLDYRRSIRVRYVEPIAVVEVSGDVASLDARRDRLTNAS